MYTKDILIGLVGGAGILVLICIGACIVSAIV